MTSRSGSTRWCRPPIYCLSRAATSTPRTRWSDRDPPLARFYTVGLHPAARAFEKIERRGVAIDLDKHHQMKDDLCAEIVELERQALDLLPRRLCAKHCGKIAAQLAAHKSQPMATGVPSSRPIGFEDHFM